MANTNDKIVKESNAGLIAHILVSIAYIAVGVVMLISDAFIISTIVYSFSVLAIGILFICFGAYYMIRYFFNQEFRRVTNYGFTMGVILVIIGAVLIFEAARLSTFIDSIVCLIGIVLGAIMFQQAFALFHIQRSSWFISLLFGFATIGISVYFLVSKLSFFKGEIIACSYLIGAGAISLISLLIMVLGLRDSKKDASRIYSRNMEDAPDTSKKASDESIFEEEPVVEVTETVQPTTDENTTGEVFDE